MKVTETISSTPIAVEKSVRTDEVRALTSCQPGLIVPLAYVPLLREDRISRGNLQVSFDMSETLKPLMNAVNVSVYAHFVSHIASDRFFGLDSFNRSYQGIPEPYDSAVIPFVRTMNFDETDPFWNTMGIYWPDGEPINAFPVEAYNILVNFRRRSRSEKIELRDPLDTSLAKGFWRNTNLRYVVPDWDQAAMDGEVPLQMVDTRVNVHGLKRYQGGSGAVPVSNLPADGTFYNTEGGTYAPVGGMQYVAIDAAGTVPRVFAELADAGVTVSLANIELAKQTAAFAKLRERYSGMEDDYLIDLLMEGIRVPDEAMKQPILLDRANSIFGYTERHAMDGPSLDESLTTGKTRLSLNFRTPPMNTGGVVLITAEIVPEQLYERQYDGYLGTVDPARYPNFMRDYLDPEKVEVVENRFVDVLHEEPTGLFGYAPLNHMWNRSITRTGGKFRRPFPDTFVEDRQRFWSVDQINPTLSDDFYLVSDLNNSVFADTISDPFEVLTLGAVKMIGNTVFGAGLQEDTDAYNKIMDQIDTSRIDQSDDGLLDQEETDDE